MAKRLKEMHPEVQILPLDYDPDVSFANIENRLQMLIMNVRMDQEERSRTQNETRRPNEAQADETQNVTGHRAAETKAG